MTPTAIVAYLTLFASAGFVFVFATLLLGRFLRPQNPNPVKLDVYECGEPTVGSGFVQFDLRFYVVALVFLLFEVEVAMFYPTAAIFGKAMQLLNPNEAILVNSADSGPAGDAEKTSAAAPQNTPKYSEVVLKKYKELGVPPSAISAADVYASNASGVPTGAVEQVQDQCRTLALASMIDLGVFFAVLLVGFAFVWSRGDLDWVRAIRPLPTSSEAAAASQLRGDD